jgi:hypothetical protein
MFRSIRSESPTPTSSRSSVPKRYQSKHRSVHQKLEGMMLDRMGDKATGPEHLLNLARPRRQGLPIPASQDRSSRPVPDNKREVKDTVRKADSLGVAEDDERAIGSWTYKIIYPNAFAPISPGTPPTTKASGGLHTKTCRKGS